MLSQQDQEVENLRGERDRFSIGMEQAFGNIETKTPEEENATFSVRYRHFGVAVEIARMESEWLMIATLA